MRALPHALVFIAVLQIVAGVAASLKPALALSLVGVDAATAILCLVVLWLAPPTRRPTAPRRLAIHQSRPVLVHGAPKEATR